jgi:hypothetical protein
MAGKKSISRKRKSISRKRTNISRKRKGISRKNKRQKKRSYKKMRGGAEVTTEELIISINTDSINTDSINTDRANLFDTYLNDEVPKGLLEGVSQEVLDEKKGFKALKQEKLITEGDKEYDPNFINQVVNGTKEQDSILGYLTNRMHVYELIKKSNIQITKADPISNLKIMIPKNIISIPIDNVGIKDSLRDSLNNLKALKLINFDDNVSSVLGVDKRLI